MKVLLCLVETSSVSLGSCQVHAIKSNFDNNPHPVSDFPKLCEPGLGKLEGVKAKIHVDQGRHSANLPKSKTHPIY